MDNTPIELYGAKTGNCLRVAIALEEASIPYTVVTVNLNRGEQRLAAHLAINPAGKVPTVIDRSFPGRPLMLSQSNAIMLYAAGRAPGTLIPLGDARRKAMVMERFFYFITDAIAVSHAAFYLRTEGQENAIQILEKRFLSAIALAEDFVSESPFMGGSSFSLADIAALTIIQTAKAQIDFNRLPNLEHWLSNVLKRPSVVAGLRAFS